MAPLRCPATSDQAERPRDALRGMTNWAVPLARLVVEDCRLTSHRFGRSRRRGCLRQVGIRLSQPHPRRGSIRTASAPPSDLPQSRDRLADFGSPHDAGFPAAHIGFVHLDRAAQEITPRPQMAAATMCAKPRRLITAQAKNALHRAHTPVIDQNPCAHLRMPRDMIFHGWSMTLFQAWQHSATCLRRI